MLLYLFHKFYYDGNIDELAKYKDVRTLILEYKNIKTNGLPSSKILEEIITFYPYLHNLFVKLFQIKYGEQAFIALMNIQDAKEQLKEADLTGQIQQNQIQKTFKT